MYFIAITHPRKLKNESEIINTLFREGLPCLHIRKPDMDKEMVESLLKKIECKYHERLMVNDHIELSECYNIKGIHFSGHTRSLLSSTKNSIVKSCSCHSFGEITDMAACCDYVFLSPVFNSISKSGYLAAFSFEELEKQLSQRHLTNVIALGGISPDKIEKVHKLGFDGLAVLGGLWNEQSTIDEVVSNFRMYKRQIELCGLM